MDILWLLTGAGVFAASLASVWLLGRLQGED